MNRTKIGVTDIALEMFAEADDDGSGELSVIEIFCFLPEEGFWYTVGYLLALDMMIIFVIFSLFNIFC